MRSIHNRLSRTRRSHVHRHGRAAAVFFVVLVALIWFRAPTSSTPQELSAHGRRTDPNVLLIVVDTLRADYVGVYGGQVATPTMDSLARAGVLFANAVSHAPTTLPAHASIFTGTYPVDHGVRANGLFELGEAETTLAETLNGVGYDTGAFVGAFVLDARYGLRQGFDVYDDRFGARGQSPHDLGTSERSASEVLARAEEWILSRGAPWFGFVHLFDPHAPYAPPSRFRDLYPDNPYAGEVAYVDEALGGFLKRLRVAGRLENTLIVLTSDHGESLGEHGEATHGMFAYDSTLRVPLILSGSDRLPAERVVRSRVRHVDIAPTIAALVGVPMESAHRGESLVSVAAAPSSPDRDSYFESLSYHIERGQAPLYGLYRGRYKYIELPLSELYDVTADGRESRNLVDGRRDDVSRLTAALAEVKTDPHDAARIAVDERTRRRLQSLGYLADAALPLERRDYTANDDPKRLVELNREFDEALTAYHAGRTREAIRRLRAVIDSRPTYGSAYKYLAYAHHSVGELGRAVDVLEEAIEHDVVTSALGSQLGAYLLEADRRSEARAVLTQVLDRSPDHVDALQSMAILVDMDGERQSAVQMLERARRSSPSSAELSANLGTMKFDAGDGAGAEIDLRRALDLDPGLADAWNVLGALYHHAGRDDDAIDCWIRAVELESAPLESLYNLGFVLVQRDRLKDAQAYLERFAREASPERHARELDDVRWLLDRLRGLESGEIGGAAPAPAH